MPFAKNVGSAALGPGAKRKPAKRSCAVERGAGVLLYAGAERREKIAEIRC